MSALLDRPPAAVGARARLAALLTEPCPGPDAGADLAVIVAHPDDETIGVGAHLSAIPAARVVHVTDGAPRDLVDARRAGFDGTEAYARARRRELEAAVAEAGIRAERLVPLGLADQGASRAMADLALMLLAVITGDGVRTVLTHAYEGGHPDHDATAFAIDAACRLMLRLGLEPPAVFAMPFYRAAPGGLAWQSFPDMAADDLVLPLPPARRALKARMIARHASQRDVLGAVSLEAERFRLTTGWDFTRLPGTGRPGYEGLPVGMTGRRWLELAAAARRRLGLDKP